MVTNKPGYMPQYRMELKVLAAFLASKGSMRSAVSGKPLKITNNQVKGPDEVVFHHGLELNGNRPNGSIARLSEIIANDWNVEIMSPDEHVNVHRERGNLGKRDYT